MPGFETRLTELHLGPGGETLGWISLPAHVHPAPGQYFSAWPVDHPEAPLATPLFPADISPERMLCAPPLPPDWSPGLRLGLRGPLGRGFHLPENARRVAAAGFDGHIFRLLPLLQAVLAAGSAAALFTDAALPPLASALEVYPLSELAGNLDWPDYLALDLPLERLPGLRRDLDLPPEALISCPGEVLLVTPLPCFGLAECGVCAVPTRGGWKLACVDGPVFPTEML